MNEDEIVSLPKVGKIKVYSESQHKRALLEKNREIDQLEKKLAEQKRKHEDEYAQLWQMYGDLEDNRDCLEEKQKRLSTLWQSYVQFMESKYGKDFEWTCAYLKEIDDLLQEISDED